MSNKTKKILVMAFSLLAILALSCGGSGRTGETHDNTGGSANVVTNHVLPA